MSYQDNCDQCKKCDEIYKNKYEAKYKWCKSCQISDFKNNFTNWISDNEVIDNLIQEIQLEINELDDIIFEWISYDQFNDIKEISEGFDKVYSAIWKDGPLDYDKYEYEYTRNQKNTKVSLKLYNLQNIVNEFFTDQGKKYSIAYIGKVLRMYGISQCPNTKDYIIVFQDIYCEKCGKKYTNIIEEWCESCHISYFKNNLNRSENEIIDNLFQEMQSKINYESEIVFEWISYDQLSNIQEMDNDDFDSIMYYATWKDGPLCYNDREWIRKSNKIVALKYLYNSQNIIGFLNKIKVDEHLNIYGISQNPDTEDYVMVFPCIYCKKCNDLYKNRFDANYEWCKSCQTNGFRQNFTNWTSENEEIDSLIQEIQLEINKLNDIIFEWIPYNQFNNIKEISEEGNDKIYSTIWKDGPLNYDKIRNEYTRNKQNTTVTLKSYDSQNIVDEFLIEIKEDINKYRGKIYGISKNIYTYDYIIVLQNEYSEICEKCDDITDYTWCRSCYINCLKNFFINCTSGNEKIDDFIQEMQLEINDLYDTMLEFIPHNQFNNIKEINKNNLATIYSAIWEDGPLLYSEKKWTRESNKKVSLKLYYLQNTDEFLNEVEKYISDDDNRVYGISQIQDIKYYIIVFKYKLCCERCGEEYTENNIRVEWCRKCKLDNLKLNFKNWTSKNDKINNLIQDMQLNINSKWDIIFEWIPYDQFYDIKKVNDDLTNKIHLAIWKNDFLYYDDLYSKENVRRLKLKVTLKYSQNITDEVEEHSIGKKYGISQDPITKDYILVYENKYYCEKCDNEYTNTNFKWCKSCQINDLRKNFTNWTSGNIQIDNLIQDIQLNLNDPGDTIFEWIPYNQFNNIKEIGKGGFATIYSAIWNKGPLSHNKYEYIRTPKQVALKQLYGSQNITIGFLNEIKGYSINESDRILSIYGISQNPDTNNYIMVLDYAEGGSLYNWINKHYKNLNWSHNIEILICIIKGLEEIHERQMVHRDFHTGNILSMYAFLEDYSSMCIADMGLCERVDNTDEENIYGVMPYVAPEVLRGRPYTQAADIYSFGMIMYFIATSRQPFSYCAHDENLALDICEGIRPKMNELEVPECYVDLMKKCWNSNPDNRPKATEIAELIHLFHESYVPNSHLLTEEKNQQHYDIEKQFKKAEEYKESNTILLEERRQSPTHPQAVYTSQLLNSYTIDLPKYSECLECEI
ncbi:unnamed protein product [Rhizophagus irregularis]|nr:unnamed protein product [Rhizophagus irregularis]